MSARTLRLNVRAVDLAAKIEAVRAERLAEYEAELAVYPEKLEAWGLKAAKHLRRVADAVENGVDVLTEVGLDKAYFGGRYQSCLNIRTPRLADMPVKPTRPDTKRMDKDIALLRATSQELVTVSTDDNLASYL